MMASPIDFSIFPLDTLYIAAHFFRMPNPVCAIHQSMHECSRTDAFMCATYCMTCIRAMVIMIAVAYRYQYQGKTRARGVLCFML